MLLILIASGESDDAAPLPTDGHAVAGSVASSEVALVPGGGLLEAHIAEDGVTITRDSLMRPINRCGSPDMEPSQSDGMVADTSMSEGGHTATNIATAFPSRIAAVTSILSESTDAMSKDPLPSWSLRPHLGVLAAFGLVSGSIAPVPKTPRRRDKERAKRPTQPSPSDPNIPTGIVPSQTPADPWSYCDQLAYHRTILGYKKAKFAGILGMPSPYYGEVERGLKPPPKRPVTIRNVAERIGGAYVEQGLVDEQGARQLAQEVYASLRDAAVAYEVPDVRSSALGFRMLSMILTGKPSNAALIKNAAMLSRTYEEFVEHVECLYPESKAIFRSLSPPIE